MTNVRIKLFVFTLLAALVVVALWPAFQSPGMPMDEGISLVYPEMFLKGHLPYRDFETIYAPGNLAILSIAYSIFGTNIFVERAVGLIYRLVILLAIFGLVQRWGTFIAAGCAFVAGVFLGGSDLFANTWMAGVAFALCSLWTMADTDSRWRCFAAGVLGAVALLCRCDLGPAFIASALPMFTSAKAEGKKRFLLGALLGISPLVWFAILVGPAQLVHSLFLFPVLHLRSASNFPISAAKADVLSMFYFHIAASIVNIAAGIVAIRSGDGRRGRLLLSVAILGLGCIYYALARFDGGHVANAAMVSISLLPASIFVLALNKPKMLPAWIKAGLAIGVVVLAMQLISPAFTRYFYRGIRVSFGLDHARQVSKTGEEIEPGDRGILVRQNGRSFPLATTQAALAAEEMLAEIQKISRPGQRLFVGPGDLRRTSYCDTFVYHLMPQLRPATYFLEMNPGSTNAPDSRLARDVESADWLVLNRAWDLINEPNQSSEFGPDTPNDVVRTKFDLWSEHGPYLIFRNKRLRNFVVPPPAR